ncbi:MAG: hypothetical protein VB080_01355 [Propionicimonas sp.]|uniref:hypothetical protein n=1 Tax=Propionicimonas sp. TaxID=1955623 RepID=UPI002B21673C|nr:hypothetical protein [Propionicimonas sp.]MEA4943062.1 hypothetical protein [Propionicimonas sp.]MEA5052630.1 hypothetical protein [Propionicimonas sp.]MEA5118699.1 hypothetical protein [Propionicimonas sp.]
MSSGYDEAVPSAPDGQPDPATGQRSIGNPGTTTDPTDEFDQPRSIGNPGTTIDPTDEYDQPRSSGNPGPHQ